MSKYKVTIEGIHGISDNEVRYYYPSQVDPATTVGKKRLERIKNADALVVCCCTIGEPAMHVKCRSTRYYLARNPNTGQLHHPLCPHYAEPHAISGRQGYTESAIKQVDDMLVITPEFSLRLSNAVASTLHQTHASGPSKRRNTVTLLGVLNLLVEQAGFNRWTPKMRGKRKYSTFAYHMAKTLLQMRFSRDKSMQQALVVVSPFQSLRDAVSTVCTAGGKTPKRRCVVIGRIKQVIKANVLSGKQTYALQHICDNDAVRFYLSEALWHLCQRSYITATPTSDNWKPDTTQYYIAISIVSMNRAGSFTIEQCAVMPTTRDFIPYDSSLERQVAEALVEQGRAFSKPLRYDSNDKTFPDFMLHDAGNIPIPMEVYGIQNNAAYTKRKHEKNLYYKNHYPNFWSWDVAMMRTMPVFPRILQEQIT